MNKRFIYTSIIFALLAWQFISYLTISRGSLEAKLLTGQTASFIRAHPYDTAFVRDYYKTDCFVGDFGRHISHNLEQNEQALKDKLLVNFLVFDKRNGPPKNQNRFQVAYITSAWYPDLLDMLFPRNLFPARQEETIIIRKNHFNRTVHYRWCLFFWIQTFEFVDRGSITRIIAKTKTPHDQVSGVSYLGWLIRLNFA